MSQSLLLGNPNQNIKMVSWILVQKCPPETQRTLCELCKEKKHLNISNIYLSKNHETHSGCNQQHFVTATLCDDLLWNSSTQNQVSRTLQSRARYWFVHALSIVSNKFFSPFSPPLLFPFHSKALCNMSLKSCSVEWGWHHRVIIYWLSPTHHSEPDSTSNHSSCCFTSLPDFDTIWPSNFLPLSHTFM